MEYVIETKNLSKNYKSSNVLKDVNMHVEAGSIYGLIGKNGAGKTTLMRIITGLQRPSGGTYMIFGVDYADAEIQKSRRRMGAIVEKSGLYENLSARDNLFLEFKLIGNPNVEEIDELLKLVALEETGRKKVRNFSLGMKQRLGIAIALASNPDFLILDEPINGLDPEGIIEIRELLLNLNRNKNITILVSSHYLDELSRIATHYGFLDRGEIVKEISSVELADKMEAKIEFKVEDVSEFVKFFESKNLSYKVTGKNRIDVYGKCNLSKLVAELAGCGLVASEVHEKEESLENYYMNLIGDEKND
ncbi:MAG TPA: bacitracin ABC transporter ATP-binding protein [Firmicutes bacterium]|nr:bacitracin ABC transporter ATP-binding protein [Bacillota bacterium]